MLKQLNFFILFLLFLSFSYAIEECKGTVTIKEIPCILLLPLNTSNTNCSTIEVSLYNESNNLFNETLSEYNEFNCNGTFNVSTYGTYTFMYSNGDSGSITVIKEADEMVSLSITLFIMLINIAIFILPFFIKLENLVWQNIIRKIFWIGGLAFLVLNISIIAYLADFAGYDLNGELFNVYMFIFSWAIYVSILLLSIEMILSSLKLNREQKESKRRGTDENAS